MSARSGARAVLSQVLPSTVPARDLARERRVAGRAAVSAPHHASLPHPGPASASGASRTATAAILVFVLGLLRSRTTRVLRSVLPLAPAGKESEKRNRRACGDVHGWREERSAIMEARTNPCTSGLLPRSQAKHSLPHKYHQRTPCGFCAANCCHTNALVQILASSKHVGQGERTPCPQCTHLAAPPALLESWSALGDAALYLGGLCCCCC